ncbi:hypothetical protein FACS1894211_11640 [Clostridia bacterium]|nr:hypothetical protein FACS1894211_11640 [Clostridia bacterium]
MALNTNKKLNLIHPVDALFGTPPITKNTEKEKTVKRSQKNFKVEPSLCEDFELYCEHVLKCNFTDAITGYMADIVAANREEIERLRKALTRQA